MEALPLLFESLGGFSPEVTLMLRELTEKRQNRLCAGEYDLTTWGARTWSSWAMQQLSVAVHRALAQEIAGALGLAAATDPARERV